MLSEADRDRILNELHREHRIGDVWYPRHSGCAGSSGGASAPHPCQGEVVAAATKRYRYPRPHAVRVFLCELHARLEDAGPLTAEDHAERVRRQANKEHWERVRAQPHPTYGPASR